MAFRKVLSGVVFALSVTGCAKHDETVKEISSDSISSSKQYFCPFMLVYRKDLDACVVPYFEETEPEKFTIATKEIKPKVIDVATARLGDGLVSLTKNTMKPLTAKEAASLAKEYDRYDPKYNGAKLYIGEQIFLVKTVVSGQEIYEWKIETKAQLDKSK